VFNSRGGKILMVSTAGGAKFRQIVVLWSSFACGRGAKWSMVNPGLLVVVSLFVAERATQIDSCGQEVGSCVRLNLSFASLCDNASRIDQTYLIFPPPNWH
jgi:hypothetical protein